MDSFWALAAALFIFGATGGMGMVIWGTLLQRRVPPHLLGRVSSLDFFVSLALMPVSMALAGPAAEVLPVGLIFLVAGTVCPVMAAVAMIAARMRADRTGPPAGGRPRECRCGRERRRGGRERRRQRLRGTVRRPPRGQLRADPRRPPALICPRAAAPAARPHLMRYSSSRTRVDDVNER